VGTQGGAGQCGGRRGSPGRRVDVEGGRKAAARQRFEAAVSPVL
jgi:hypothetical protein